MRLPTLTFALLGALAMIAPLAASAQAYDQWMRPAVVADRTGATLTLSNGQVVYMHEGTVINPVGIDLQPGMTVFVYGHYDADGNVVADEVDARNAYRPPADGYYDRYGNWHAYARGYYDQYGNWHPSGY